MTAVRQSHRLAGDGGTALVEMAFVVVMLFILLFGMIAIGVALSFKHSVTQSASDAARAAAVVVDDPATVPDEREEAAIDRYDALVAYNRTCDPLSTGMTCAIDVHDCSASPGIDTVALPDCITVDIEYDYGAHPIVPVFPLIEPFTPDRVASSATAQISDFSS